MKKIIFARYTLLMLFMFIGVSFSMENSGKGGELINLGTDRQIFVDNYLIDSLSGTQIVKHTPHDEGPVLFLNKPWEGNFCAYFTIIQDKGLYRAYYRGSTSAMQDGSKKEITCLAESKDGIHWEKPNLRLYEMNGSYDNNVVLANEAPASHNFSPFLDKNPNANPDQRYKALAGMAKYGLMAYTSPDGIHWKKLKDGVLKKGNFDSQNVAFWSESEKCYVCYFRTWTGGAVYKGFRSVSRAISTDFINWSEPVAMTFGDTPLEDLYTQQTHPYFRAPQIYVAIGGRFMSGRQILTDVQAKDRNVDPQYFKDCSDVYFMTTRGGNVYDRTFMESFIRPGIGLNNWVSRTNYPALNVVQTSPEEMSIYVNQDYAQPSAHLCRYSMRIDGFSSISAPYSGGEVFTRPFTFGGNKLEINYSTSAAGEIRFEIQDEQGIPISGYTMNDSQPIIGNEIARVVLWNGSGDLKKLASKTIRLRISMKDADLYSLQFNQ